MAQPKKGRIVRVSTDAFKYFRSRADNLREAVDLTVQELIDLRARLELIESAPVLWILPESGRVFRSKAKAKGEALLSAAKRGRSEPDEVPKPVREVV